MRDWPNDEASEKLKSGLSVRRAVLGDAYVDNSLATIDEITEPLQSLVTEYCWGEVWTRNELPRPTRSLLNVVMLTALNRPHELKIHLMGALRNGCTEVEIREAILQSAIYCGVPAAIDAMRTFTEVRRESAQEDDREDVLKRRS